MIYIDASQLKCKLPPDWEKRASAVLLMLESATSNKERKRIIENNSRLWGELKGTLKSMSGGKCWFTESENDGSYSDVEHFRPKLKVTEDSTHSGYWWLAFNYENYRFSCQILNTSGKRNYFPLAPGSFRAKKPGDELSKEIVMLLDPTNISDPPLLTFVEDGKAIPAAAEDTFDCDRAKISIKYYVLNHDNFVEGRLKLLTQIDCFVDLVDSLQSISPETLNELKKIVCQFTANNRAYSAFSKCILKKKALIHACISQLI
jgi:hypothetical protein